MFTSIMLCMVFSGIQDHPAGYVEGTTVYASPWSPPGTTFVAGFNAILNISKFVCH
jgi:hypothetical protein